MEHLVGENECFIGNIRSCEKICKTVRKNRSEFIILVTHTQK